MARRKGTDMFRIKGVYAGLILHQQRAAVSIDLRLLDWSLEEPAAKAADRAALEYETKLNPQPSKLLEKLLDGQPVTVSWRALPHVADPPAWLSDPRVTPYVRVRADDLVTPADGPPDQAAQMMG